MLNKDLALNLIKRVREHLKYNINIMDEEGIIIASCDESRIGDFHEVAYNVVKGNYKEGIIYPTENYPKGVKPGVNLPIVYNNTIIGVVGVTGNPEEVLNLSYVLKTTVETMIEYELYKNKVMRRQDKKNLFINMLLYEEGINITEIRNLSDKLGYREELLRIPILFRFKSNLEPEEIAAFVKQSSLHSKQNITFVTLERNVCVFKVIKEPKHMFIEGIKAEVIDYLEGVRKAIEFYDSDFEFKCYVGSLQRSFKLYRQAYNHALWLNDYLDNVENKIHFFFDYTYQYFHSRIPFSDFYGVFSVFDEFLDEKMRSIVIDTLIVLFKSNMNITHAAKMLGIHRNTMMFRIEKVKEIFGLDPVHSESNGQFLFLLAHYLSHEVK